MTKKSNIKNVYLLSLTSFFNDVGSEIILAIIPFFLNFLGASGLIVGLVAGLRDATSNFFKSVFGYLSDKLRKRKAFVFFGYLTSATFKLLLSLSNTWQHVLVFFSLERIGKGLREAPRDAMIAESLPKEKGKAFGINRAFDTLGAIIGSLLAFVLLYFFSLSYNTIILIGALISFLSIFPLLFVNESIKNSKKKKIKVILNKKLKYFIFVSCLFALSNISYMFFVLKAQKAFFNSSSVVVPLFLYVLFNVAYTISAVPLGKLSDKVGRKLVILIGFILYALTSIGFIFFNVLPLFIILFITYGISLAIIEVSQKAIVSELSKEGIRATSLGIFQTSYGISTLIGNVIAGYLWQINYSLTFVYSSCMSILTLLLMLKL